MLSLPSARAARRAVVTGLVTAIAASALVAVGAPPAEARPTVKISKVTGGLTIPWDLTWVGDLMVFDERGGALWSKRGSKAAKKIKVSLPSAYVNGEGGRLGLVADPGAAANKRFYLCQTYKSGGRPVDVRVLRLRLRTDTTATLDVQGSDRGVVVDGLPVSSGRHSGCRLRFGPDGKLYVGTGDAARGKNPQDLGSLGGKVLRVNSDGSIPTDNPFYSRGGDARYVWTYGHRNVQGLAVRPGTDELWSAEQGTKRDDEINLTSRGANYGWDPGPGYDESRPMTDQGKFPDAIPARWDSGKPTVATSGLTFLKDSAWGHWQGAMAVGLLAGQGIRLLFLDPAGRVISQTDIAGLDQYKRIRTVQYGPDGSLYFTTSNGGGKDIIGKITPTAKPPSVDAGDNVSPVGVSAVRTGTDVYAFIRTTGDEVVYKRSTDDGSSWPSAWASTGLTSRAAPAVASSAPGRVDLVTQNAAGAVTHTAFVDGVRQGSSNLGGKMTAATVSSLGDGTLDVFGLRVSGGAYRIHFDGYAWSAWRKIALGGFTSRIGAAAQPATGQTRVTVRGTTGAIYERVLTANADGDAWTTPSGKLWSGRALGDRQPNRSVIAVSRGSDGYVRLERDAMSMALNAQVTSEPDVVTRPDGSWILFGRSTSNALIAYDARPGGYQPVNLGGTVR